MAASCCHGLAPANRELSFVRSSRSRRSEIDKELASGEYFLKASQKRSVRKWKPQRLNKQKLSVRDKRKETKLLFHLKRNQW
uniref:KRR1 small subunit processome component homolog isoform X2 n=1 Tax=Nyctereutes procyonoides TaxID=34880 RepID=UPI002444C416|nr:KRR1 small subunit processome component homolog isoform X2 [Nyctereutes procyonoides]